MPLGIALIEWDDHYGATLRSMYPKNLNLNNDIALQLYTSQTMGDISVPRYSLFQTNEIRVAGYFGGEKDNSLIIIVLDENDNPDKYKLFLILCFNTYINNNNKIEIFLENAYQDLLLLDENLKKESILSNKKIQSFLFNVIKEEINEIKPKLDLQFGLYYPQLVNYLEVKPNEVDIFLDFLIKHKFLIPEVIDNICACPGCESINLIYKLMCPDCESIKIEKNVTIQHEYCGHIDFLKHFYHSTNNQMICPKCNSIIQNDHGIKNKGIFYKCLEKETFFKQGKEVYECRNCGKIAKKDEMKFESLFSYKINLEKVNQILNFKEF